MLPAILGAPRVPGSPASQWVLVAVLCMDVDSGTFPPALESEDPGGWSPSPPPTWPRPAWGVKGPACLRPRPAARGPPTWAWAGAVTLACGSSLAPPTPPWAAPGHAGVGLCLRHIHRWLQAAWGTWACTHPQIRMCLPSSHRKFESKCHSCKEVCAPRGVRGRLPPYCPRAHPPRQAGPWGRQAASPPLRAKQ